MAEDPTLSPPRGGPNSSIAGQAGTAAALAAAPTQCTGTFATGIQANGNANCPIAANQITMQFPGTLPPAASGYGNLWFTSAGVFYNTNGGSNIQLTGYANLASQVLGQANNAGVEVFDGTTPTDLYVYQTEDGASPYLNYSRIGLYYDSGGSDMVVSSESGGTGTLHNLGFRTGSAIKWEITTTGNPGNEIRPFVDNVYDIGDATHRVRNLYMGLANGCLNIASGEVGTTGSACGSGGGMVYPGAGIGNSTGSTWGTSYTTSGTGTVVALTASPTFTGTLNAAAGNFTGNLTVGGTIIQTGGGAMEVTGSGGTLTAPGASQSSFGINASLHFQIALNASSSFNDIVITQTCAAHKWLSQVDQVATVGNCTQPTLADVAAGVAPAGTFDFTSATPKVPTGTANSNNTNAASEAYVDTNYMSTWMPLGANFSNSTGIAFNTTTSHAQVFGITLRQAVTTSQVSFYLVAADSTGADTYDIGLFAGTAGSSDNLLVHTGAVTATSYFTSTGAVTIPWTATVTLPPGRYYLALYANEASAPATIGQNSSLDFSFYHNSSFSITPASGALPPFITGPTDGFTGGTAEPYLILH